MAEGLDNARGTALVMCTLTEDSCFGGTCSEDRAAPPPTAGPPLAPPSSTLSCTTSTTTTISITQLCCQGQALRECPAWGGFLLPDPPSCMSHVPCPMCHVPFAMCHLPCAMWDEACVMSSPGLIPSNSGNGPPSIHGIVLIRLLSVPPPCPSLHPAVRLSLHPASRTFSDPPRGSTEFRPDL